MSRSNPRSSVRNTARETGRYVVSTTLGEAVQAFVPLEKLDAFKAEMEAILGAGKCHILSIRPEGGAVL